MSKVAFYQWSKACQIYSKIVGTRDFRGDVWLEEKQQTNIADLSTLGYYKKCIEGTGYKNLEATP